MKKEKEPKTVVKKDWISLSGEDVKLLEENFIHFTGKSMNSSISSVGIRLENGKGRPELPYLGLSTLGADFNDLDFTLGGAGGIPKPRQVKDIITGVSSGVIRDLDAIPAGDKELLDLNGPFVKALSQSRNVLPEVVPTLMKQIIVKDSQLGDVVLSPVGALGLTGRILAKLNDEMEKRKALDPKAKRFFGKGINNLGGEKPQNIGLLCAVKGGPAIAGFAWHFKSPGFPVFKERMVYSNAFREVDFYLNDEDAMRFRAVVQRWKDAGFTLSSEFRSLESVLRDLISTMKNRVEVSRQSLEVQLKEDYEKSEMEYMGSALENLLVSENLPTYRENLWSVVLDKSELSAGWLVKSLRTPGWASEASSKMLTDWLNQVGIPLSSSEEKKLVTFLAAEVYKS